MYILRGDGVEIGITDFGAAVQYIILDTVHGKKDICLGYDTIAERLDSGTYCGATIGRVANRIRGAEFSLGEKVYNVPANDGKNCNHGGNGFDTRFFDVVSLDPLIMRYVSHDGDEGFPGNLTLDVKFTLEGKTFCVDYTAESDKDTVWAPTCHIYFDPEGDGNAMDSVLSINADRFTPLDSEHIPTGEILSVSGTPFDFTVGKPIRRDIDIPCVQLTEANGYDHNFVLNKGCAATVVSASGDIKLYAYTDMPGLQLYTGNFVRGKGKGRVYAPRSGFCLEPQYFPNSVNVSAFKSPFLGAGEKREQSIRYVFEFK